ncbi:MAG: sodium:solute symporter family protein [Eubacterium sp.]|nr:sodium:solute symporter family protein [Eubacterium sp.]
MQAGHIIGIIIVFIMMGLMEIISTKRVKSAKDFEKSGGKAGAALVMGAMMGTFIGAQATVGTAQMGYIYGMAGVWYTFGGAIGFLVMCFLYVVPLRRSDHTTIMELISEEYGPASEVLGSVLSSIGMLISSVSGVLGTTALLMSLFGWSFSASCIAASLFACVYVEAGGLVGAGNVGKLKLVLLFFLSFISIVAVLRASGGIGEGTLLPIDLSTLFARGVGKETVNGLATVAGVIGTQTYVQSVWSAKDDRTARKATVLAGGLCIPIGLAGTLVGIFMGSQGMLAATEAGKAYPMFIMTRLPSLLGGLCLGGLLITTVTGSGGLVLGISTIFVRDVLGKLTKRELDERARLRASRITIAVIMTGMCLASLALPGTLMNDLGFLSMGLRATIVMVPMTLALFFPGRFRPKAVLAAMIAGPAALIAAQLTGVLGAPLLAGTVVSLLTCVLGSLGAGKTNL